MKRHGYRTTILLAALSMILLGLHPAPLRAEKHRKQEAVTGSGNVIKENRPVSGFNAIDVSGIGELTAIQGDREALTIEAEDNIVPFIVTEVKDGCLYIHIKSKMNIQPKKPLRYALTVKELNRVSLSGVVKAAIGNLSADSFKVGISGACQATFAGIQANRLTADMSGASSVKIAGKTDSQKIDLSGACHYEASALASKSAEVGASGASKAVVQVNDSLKVQASGVSSIRYRGAPTVMRNVSGIASIKEE